MPLGRILYNLGLSAGFLAGFPFFYLILAHKSKLPKPLKEAFGLYPSASLRWVRSPCRIWIQAASVGEVGVAFSFIQELLKHLPDVQLLLTTTTPQGRDQAQQMAAGLPNLTIFHYPLDLNWAVKSALKKWTPHYFIPIETEIWPNFIHHAKAMGAKVIVVNGRISDRSFPRYLRAKYLFAATMRLIDLVLAISYQDSQRFQALGVAPERIRITGNIKMDIAIHDDLIRKKEYLYKLLGISPQDTVFIAGSTRPGEEEDILAAAKGLSLRLIIAPRHMDRVCEVVEMAKSTGQQVALLSTFLNTPERQCLWDVLIVDTIGHLMPLYGLSHIAFLGGSLRDFGGQNMVEPAAWGLPVIFGPYTQNFRDVAAALEKSGGGVRVKDRDALRGIIKRLITSVDLQKNMGRASRNVVESSKGAKIRYVNEFLKFIGE